MIKMLLTAILLLQAISISAPTFAAEAKLSECPDLDKFYPTLEKSYNHKAPLLAKAGWGKLQDWGVDDFEQFRTSVLQCKEKGFFKKLDPVFLQSDLEKKLIEMRKEATRLRDDVKIAATLLEYKKRVDVLAKNLDEKKAAELEDIKDQLTRLTGIDDSAHFNEAGALENRIDKILLKNPKSKAPQALVSPQVREPSEAQLAARNEDPVRFQECGKLKEKYQGLVEESLLVEKKLKTEQGVEGMKALNVRKDAILHELESLSIQMREKTCAKFFEP
ncbi:MAG: hypothetical protein ACXWQO_06380 [Bdellovibrionota bacterium]